MQINKDKESKFTIIFIAFCTFFLPLRYKNYSKLVS